MFAALLFGDECLKRPVCGEEITEVFIADMVKPAIEYLPQSPGHSSFCHLRELKGARFYAFRMLGLHRICVGMHDEAA